MNSFIKALTEDSAEQAAWEINPESLENVLRNIHRVYIEQRTSGITSETGKEATRVPPMSEAEAEARWQETGPKWRTVLLNTPFDPKIQARLKEHKNLDFWEKVFEKIDGSKFLLGTGNGSWKCTLDWLTANDKNCLKVYEGVYDNASKSKETPGWNRR